MTHAVAVLDAPTAAPAVDSAPVLDPPPAGAVALVVDGSVAALAAAAWAAQLAGQKQTSLLVVVLVGSAPSQAEDAAAVLARVQPALDRGGRPYTVRVCTTTDRGRPGRRARRAARRLRQLVPADVGLVVCPGDGTAAGLAEHLAVGRRSDLLVVPDLRSLGDAAAATQAAEPQVRQLDEQPEVAR